jgi:hypothetical protein
VRAHAPAIAAFPQVFDLDNFRAKVGKAWSSGARTVLDTEYADACTSNNSAFISTFAPDS